MCAGAIVNARIKMIVFGCYDEKEGCCHAVMILGHLIRTKSAEIKCIFSSLSQTT